MTRQRDGVVSPTQPEDFATLAPTPSFAAEADMLAAIASAPSALAGRRRGSRNPQVLFEFFGAEGTPDIVFLEFDESELRRRDLLDLPPIRNYSEVAALIALSKGPMTARELSGAIGVTAAHLRRAILPALEDDSWVKQAGPQWFSPEPIRPLADWIVAIEAKRRDWRRALAQAHRYLRFANRSIAVLDASANLGSALEQAESQGGVGLASVDADRGRVRPLVLPKWHRASSYVEFIWAGEQAYSMRQSGAVSGPVLPVFGRMLYATQGPDPRLGQVVHRPPVKAASD